VRTVDDTSSMRYAEIYAIGGTDDVFVDCTSATSDCGTNNTIFCDVVFNQSCIFEYYNSQWSCIGVCGITKTPTQSPYVILCLVTMSCLIV